MQRQMHERKCSVLEVKGKNNREKKRQESWDQDDTHLYERKL